MPGPDAAPERELTEPVTLLLANGRQNPAAVGWTRRQLHDTDSLGRGLYGWGRNKRWEYWAITTPTHIIALTIAGLDFASLHQLWVLDRATLTEIDSVVIGPFSRNVTLPGTLGPGRPSRGRRRCRSTSMRSMAAPGFGRSRRACASMSWRRFRRTTRRWA